METDWSTVVDYSALLDRNERDWRPALDDLGPVEHKSHCWLGTNYDSQPDVAEIRARGCDCGATKEAIQRLAGGR